MTDGREGVEDCVQLGLTLRDHPLALLREDLERQTYETFAEAVAPRDLKFARVTGIFLVAYKLLDLSDQLGGVGGRKPERRFYDDIACTTLRDRCCIPCTTLPAEHGKMTPVQGSAADWPVHGTPQSC